MLRIVVGIFVVLHGLVHLLYLGQSLRFFELQPGMTWPDGSWAFGRFLSESSGRRLAALGCALAAAAFAAGGGAFIAQLDWARVVIAGAAAFSTLLYLFFWNGKGEQLDNQGVFAVLINVGLIVGMITIW